jgi:hypothetical protein
MTSAWPYLVNDFFIDCCRRHVANLLDDKASQTVSNEDKRSPAFLS